MWERIFVCSHNHFYFWFFFCSSYYFISIRTKIHNTLSYKQRVNTFFNASSCIFYRVGAQTNLSPLHLPQPIMPRRCASSSLYLSNQPSLLIRAVKRFVSAGQRFWLLISWYDKLAIFSFFSSNLHFYLKTLRFWCKL